VQHFKIIVNESEIWFGKSDVTNSI